MGSSVAAPELWPSWHFLMHFMVLAAFLLSLPAVSAVRRLSGSWAGVGGLTLVTTERSIGSWSVLLSWWAAGCLASLLSTRACGSRGCIWGLHTIGRALFLIRIKALIQLVAFLLGVVGQSVSVGSPGCSRRVSGFLSTFRVFAFLGPSTVPLLHFPKLCWGRRSLVVAGVPTVSDVAVAPPCAFQGYSMHTPRKYASS